MGAVISLIDLVVSGLKSMQWHGISLWTAVQVVVVVDILLIPIIRYFLASLRGGGD